MAVILLEVKSVIFPLELMRTDCAAVVAEIA